jgi:antitoxin VapB
MAMPETRPAKLFKNGSSQAVRLPAEFRFEGTEVYATRDETTGDVTLSKSPGAKQWKDFFAFARTVDVPDDFMADRPMNTVPSKRGVFDDEIESVKPKRKKASKSS